MKLPAKIRVSRHKTKHPSPWYYWPFRWVALTGGDGEPSFSKLVIVAVIGSYFVDAAIPFGIATLVVSASYGRAMLRDFLTRGSVTLREATTSGHASKVGGAVREIAAKVETVARTVGEKTAAAAVVPVRVSDELSDESGELP